MPTSQPMTFLISASGVSADFRAWEAGRGAVGLEGPGAQERPFFPLLWVGAQWRPRLRSTPRSRPVAFRWRFSAWYSSWRKEP